MLMWHQHEIQCSACEQGERSMNEKAVIPVEQIESIILLIRGQKVILDHHLAQLYGIPTKVLKQAVRRNIKRFPSDFMFSLVWQEVTSLRSQIVTSKPGRGGSRYLSMAFTEQGVAMLSSVLNSERAIQLMGPGMIN